MANIFTTTVDSNDVAAGTRGYGFGGEVPVTELWNGEELASLLGISEGDLSHKDEPWLKFYYNGRILFKSKKPYRTGISYDHLLFNNAVDGSEIIEDHRGNKYKVRLMKGTFTNPAEYDNHDKGAKFSEWNALMLPIHEEAKKKKWNKPEYVEDDIPSNWDINYENSDLVLYNGNGYYHWCQEELKDKNNAIIRGSYGPSHIHRAGKSDKSSTYGWSPVLEMIDHEVFYLKKENNVITKSGIKTLSKENLKEVNGYEPVELNRREQEITYKPQGNSFYKSSVIDLKRLFDIKSMRVKE